MSIALIIWALVPNGYPYTVSTTYFDSEEKCLIAMSSIMYDAKRPPKYVAFCAKVVEENL